MSSFPVLIVEDKDSLRAMLRHALEAHGHAVLEARDETEAIQQLRQARPVVVLTDLKLPVGDGFGVLLAARGKGGGESRERRQADERRDRVAPAQSKRFHSPS